VSLIHHKITIKATVLFKLACVVLVHQIAILTTNAVCWVWSFAVLTTVITLRAFLLFFKPKEATTASTTVILTHPRVINLAILSTFFVVKDCKSCLTCCPCTVCIAVLTIATETSSQITVSTLSNLLVIILLTHCLI
jgi:hypothetical protein